MTRANRLPEEARSRYLGVHRWTPTAHQSRRRPLPQPLHGAVLFAGGVSLVALAALLTMQLRGQFHDAQLRYDPVPVPTRIFVPFDSAGSSTAASPSPTDAATPGRASRGGARPAVTPAPAGTPSPSPLAAAVAPPPSVCPPPLPPTPRGKKSHPQPSPRVGWPSPTPVSTRSS